ncbi:MAG TPA: hypothetical protein VL978_07000 [Puia sp.]|nr:hypothetical protein [Puia sp.]
MKTIFTLSLLPIIVAAYFFSTQLYIAANYVPAYSLIVIFLAAVVFCIYQVGATLQRQRA